MDHVTSERTAILRSIDERLFYQEELMVVEEPGRDPVIYKIRPSGILKLEGIPKEASIRRLTYGESFAPSMKTAMDKYREQPLELQWEKNQDQS